ncbi:MAG: DHH family phosphoesterase [Euryarchaeota archaeon]|nr:DHH family phosphoesterase [Euryarchaeota archaeon]
MDEKKELFQNLKGKGLIIHHWDTDGICSAHILLHHLSDKKIVNKTPIIGNYFLTEQELKSYAKYDFIIILDMSLPESNIKILAQKAQVFIFDHHLGSVIPYVFHHNPVINGEKPEKYPSTSWIINTFFGKAVNIHAILGVVGDHENNIQKNKVFSSVISEFCKTSNLNFADLVQMTYLLDSCYKVGDKTMVEKLPKLLLKETDGHSIVQNDILKNNLMLLEQEITKHIIHHGEEINGVLVKKIDTKYNIISTVTRKIAWDSKKNTLVINTGFFADRNQIYVRSNKNMEPLIARGKTLGYNCGGKKEVLGAIVPKEETDSFVQEILRFLQ